MSNRLRNICFTINNYTEDSYNELSKILEENCDYYVIGKEIGKETSTPHLQGYCELKKQLAFNTVKSWMPLAHIEARKGSAKQASDYCKKENNFQDFGTLSQQGKRNDIEIVHEEAKKKTKLSTFIKEHQPNFQQLRVFEIIQSHYQDDRDFKPEVWWIYGPSGTGKTRYVYEKEKDLWISGKNLKWWEGYCNQEATLFDDFRKDFCTYHELLRILDRYPLTTEVKGGSRKLNSRRMYITSCFHPKEVYDTREDIRQLIRRIDHIVLMENFDSKDCDSEVGGNTYPDTSELKCYLD